MTEGRGDRGLYDGRNVSGVSMWLEVGDTGDCMMDALCQEPGCVAGGRKDRGMYDGGNVSGARMWLEVGAKEDSMVEAIYKEP